MKTITREQKKSLRFLAARAGNPRIVHNVLSEFRERKGKHSAKEIVEAIEEQASSKKKRR